MRCALIIPAILSLTALPGCTSTADKLALSEAYELCKGRESGEARDACVRNVMVLKKEQRAADLERCDALVADAERDRAVLEGYGVEDGRTARPLPDECGIGVRLSKDRD